MATTRSSAHPRHAIAAAGRSRRSLTCVLGVLPAPAAATRPSGCRTPTRSSPSTPTRPATPLSVVAITGLQSGETALAIDVRPATGQLYLLGSSSRVYVVNPVTGAATAVGAAVHAGALGHGLRVRLQPDGRSHPGGQRHRPEPAAQPRHRRGRGGRWRRSTRVRRTSSARPTRTTSPARRRPRSTRSTRRRTSCSSRTRPTTARWCRSVRSAWTRPTTSASTSPPTTASPSPR